MSSLSTKQRMISAADLAAPEYMAVPDEAKPTAVWLWLHLDPLGRGPMDPVWIAAGMYPQRSISTVLDTVETHLVMLAEAEFLTTYRAAGAEWILLRRPLRVDLRKARISTPEPPSTDRPWPSMAVGGGREWARERARERVRAEDAARADAWAAVREDRAAPPEPPERPMLLDAPPMFCDDHMPYGAGKTKCGPCRDSRLFRDKWLAERVYEQRMAEHFEETGTDDDEPF